MTIRRTQVMRALRAFCASLLLSCSNSGREGVFYDCTFQSCTLQGRIAMFCVDPERRRGQGTGGFGDSLDAQVNRFVSSCRATCPSSQTCSVTDCQGGGGCAISDD
jgi:hypothetical protein